MGEHKPGKTNEGVCLCQVRCWAVGRKLQVVIQFQASLPRLSRLFRASPRGQRQPTQSGHGELSPVGTEGLDAQSQKPGPNRRVKPEKVDVANPVGPLDLEA